MLNQDDVWRLSQNKQSYHVKVFLKTGSFQCGAMDVKRFYEKHVLDKYGNNYTDPSLSKF